MFGISINNDWLDLPKDFKIRLRLESSLFQTTYKSAAYSFPATLPDSDKNRKLTGYYSDVQVSSAPITGIPCKLVCGVIEWPGLLWVDRSVHSKNIQITIKLIQANSGKKLLTDLDYGGKRNGPGDSNPWPEAPDVTNDYTRSIHRDYYWGMYYNNTSAIGEYEGIINDFDQAGTPDRIATDLGIPPTQRYTPMPYLNYVLKKIAQDIGIGTSGSWWADEELDSLVVFNNRTIGSVYSALLATYVYSDFDLKYHVPVMTVDDLLGQIKNTFCMLIETFNGKMNVATYRDIERDFKVKDWTGKSNRVYERTRSAYNGYEIGSTFDPADKLYEQLVKPLKDKGPDYLGSLATQPVTGALGQWFYDTYYRYYRAYDGAGSWVFHSFGYEGVKTGEGELQFITPCCAPVFRPQNQPPPLGYRMPWVEMDSEGRYSLTFSGSDVTDYGLRLCFARGWYFDQILGAPADTRFIPVISGEAAGEDGTIWGNYSLRYIEDKGLHNVFWKNFLRLAVNNDGLAYNLVMTEKDLAEWTFGEYLRVGGEVFLPKALDVELSRSGVNAAVCECVKKV